MRKALSLFVLCAFINASCASLPAKQTTVVSLQASETALEAAHDAERLICSPSADKTKAITHCDGPQAASIGLTDARHVQLARAFSKAFDTEIKAATVLKAVPVNGTMPASLAEYQADLNAILALVSEVFPKTAETAVKVQQAVDEAAKAAALLGVK
jgi:hypothetical protein